MIDLKVINKTNASEQHFSNINHFNIDPQQASQNQFLFVINKNQSQLIKKEQSGLNLILTFSNGEVL